MSEYLIQGSTLTAIADAIRAKDGSTDAINTADMADRIAAIESGGSGDAQTTLDALIDKSITEISSNVTSVGAYAFYSCTALTKADMPNATSIGTYGFSNCRALTEVNIPKAISIAKYGFGSCFALKKVYAPNVSNALSGYTFRYCESLESMIMPNVTSLGAYEFEDCYALTTLDFSALTSIGNGALADCTNLTALILRAPIMAKLTVTMSGNAIANGTGYIYVPSALIDTYKSSSNWAACAEQFRALEDYTVDGTTTGALDESKI